MTKSRGLSGWRSVGIGAWLALVGAGAAGCGVGASSEGTPDARAIEPSDVVTVEQQGRAIMVRRNCGACHNPANPAEGLWTGQILPAGTAQVYPSNLTPDPATGLGNWTEEQIIAAVRQGVRNDGTPLCFMMRRYPDMTDEDAHAMVMYLRSVPAVSRQIPTTMCPPPPPPSDAGARDAAVDASGHP